MTSWLVPAVDNTPEYRKSAIRKWYDRVTGQGTLVRAKLHAHATGHTVRSVGESLLVGGALGALHAELQNGLDVPAGKTGHTVPIDAATAGVAAIAGIATAGDDISTDLRNVAASAASVFAFRKVHEFAEKKKLQRGGAPGGAIGAKGSTAHGDSDWGEDPIVAAARML